MIMQDDAAKLRQYMTRFGLVQAEAAERLGVSQSTIHRVLAGTGTGTGRARQQIAAALARVQNAEDEYSLSQGAGDELRDLHEKVAQMCERDGDATVLGALLDAVAAYRRRIGE